VTEHIIFYKGIPCYILNMGYRPNLKNGDLDLEEIMQIQQVEMAHSIGKEKTQTIQVGDPHIYYPISGIDFEGSEWITGISQYFLNGGSPGKK